MSTRPANGGPVAPDNAAPKIADDGSIVVFDSTTPGVDPAAPSSVVTIRDRTNDTTTNAPDTPSLHPGVSGDGCVVAYSVPVAATRTVQLTALDRCAAAGGSLVGSAVVVGTVAAVGALPAPALSTDGSVIVWSTGRTISRFVKSAGGYQTTSITVPSAAFNTPAVVTGAAVDISGDGNVVAFVAGPGTVDFQPAPANVFLWSDPDGTGPNGSTVELASIARTGGPGTGDSTSPSVSADGRILVFESSSPDLAAVGPTNPTAPFVVVLDRQGTARLLVGDATHPTISADGKVVVFDTSTDVHTLRWVGGTQPFESVSEASLSIGVDGVSSAGPSVSGPVVTANGSLIAFDSANGPALTTDVRFGTGAHVWARAGIGEPPLPTTTTATTTPTSTIGPTTTSAPPTTTSTATLPSTTIPATTNASSTATPRPTTPPSRPSSGSGSSGGNSGRPRSAIGSGASPTYSTGSVEAVAFVPGGVEFSPTIVAAGRQSTVLSVSNLSSRTVTVADISIEGGSDGAFTLSDEACIGISIPPGASCDVSVSYAPVTVGSTTVQIVATLVDGSVVYGDLSGTGAAPPVVTVVPGVASSGQVVAIQGSGFPAGVTVQLSWLDSDSALEVEVDETGSFVKTLIVLPNTSRGPGSAVVVGQADLFGTVVGPVLITDTSDRSSSALTQSAGSPFAS